jgi:hypothetical protein
MLYHENLATPICREAFLPNTVSRNLIDTINYLRGEIIQECARVLTINGAEQKNDTHAGILK